MLLAHRAAALAALLATLLAAGARVSASPLAEDHLSSELEGPAEASVTSAYWNPAALGFLSLHGEHAATVHFLASGLARIDTGSVQRSAIDDQHTGLPGPGANRSFPSIDPFGVTPGAFLGIAGEAGPFVGAFALYTPFARYQKAGLGATPAQDGPGRYQGLETLEYDTYATFASSIRVSDRIFAGIGFSLVFSQAHLVFDRDTALDGGSALVGSPDPNNPGRVIGFENDAYAQRIDVGGQATSVSASIGLAWRPIDDLYLGFAYVARPFTASRSDVQLGPTLFPGIAVSPNAVVIQPSCTTTPSGPICRELQGFGNITYVLPDSWNLGARLRLSHRLEAALSLRLLTFGVQRTIDVRLVGPQLGEAGVPEHIARFRGLQATFSADARLAYRATPSLRLAAGLVAQNGEAPEANINVAELDASKLEPYLQLEWTPRRGLSFSFLYALGIPVPVTTNPGVFDPQQAVECVDDHYNLQNPACDPSGAGSPTAAGSYSLLFHTVAAGVRWNFFYL